MTLVMAEIESQRFTFRAVGETKAKALEALRAAFRAHARDYGLGRDWYHDLVHPDDKWEDCVTLMDLTPGCGYRDHDEISRARKCKRRAA